MAQKELDRFDTNAKRDTQISTKLMGILGGMVVFASAVVALLCIEIYSRNSKKQTEESLVRTGDGAQRVIDDWVVTLHGYAYETAQRQDVIAAIENNDSSALLSIVRANNQELDFELMAIVDRNGTVLPGGGQNINVGVNLSSSAAVSSALRGNGDFSYEPLGTSPYAAIYSYPIRNSSGSIIGATVFAYDLSTDDFVTLMKSGYGVECTIFNGDVRIASSLPNVSAGSRLERQDITSQVLQRGIQWAGELDLNGIAYFGVYNPLKNENGTITGMIFIAQSLESITLTRGLTLRIVIPVVIVLIVILVIASSMFVRWLMWRIANVTNFLKELETGDADLTRRCKLFIRDEIGDLVIHFDFFLDKLQEIIKEVKDSKVELQTSGEDMAASTQDTASAITEIIANIDGISAQITNQGVSVKQTASAVEEISDNITTLDSMIESQSSGVSQASAAVEQMIGNISSVNQSVDKMASSFDSLAKNAQTGFTKQQDVNDRIKQIENQSQMLQEANQAISAIAEQTNLLAMNAAIEAAHAGEAGKGFSVVADEIRKLSETSSAQSKTIGEQLNNIKDSIAEVVAASQESSEAFTAVSNKIHETDELVLQIKAAMEEQNSGSKQISSALKGMNDSTVEVRRSSKEMSGRNERIMREMQTLKDVTDSMQQSMTEMSEGAKKINETGSALSDISGHVRTSIGNIGEQIDRFKV